MKLFDEEFDEMMKGDKDSSEEVASAFEEARVYPLPAEKYLAPASAPIKTGNEVLGLIDKERPLVPGYVNAANKLHGLNNWDCNASIGYADLTKSAYIFERLEYAKEELSTEIAKEVGIDNENGEWFVSKNAKDSYNLYELYADGVIKAEEGKEIAIYACKNIGEGKVKLSILVFLGTYTIDKARSLYYRRTVMHRVSKYWSFAKKGE